MEKSSKALNMVRARIAVPAPLYADLVELAKERGVEFSEIVRIGMFEFVLRQRKLVPRQRRPKSRHNDQVSMSLEQCA